jgi:hypothetical protein
MTDEEWADLIRLNQRALYDSRVNPRSAATFIAAAKIAIEIRGH